MSCKKFIKPHNCSGLFGKDLDWCFFESTREQICSMFFLENSSIFDDNPSFLREICARQMLQFFYQFQHDLSLRINDRWDFSIGIATRTVPRNKSQSQTLHLWMMHCLRRCIVESLTPMEKKCHGTTMVSLVPGMVNIGRKQNINGIVHDHQWTQMKRKHRHIQQKFMIIDDFPWIGMMVQFIIL